MTMDTKTKTFYIILFYSDNREGLIYYNGQHIYIYISIFLLCKLLSFY